MLKAITPPPPTRDYRYMQRVHCNLAGSSSYLIATFTELRLYRKWKFIVVVHVICL